MKTSHKLFYLFLIAWVIALLCNGVIISENYLEDVPGTDLERALTDIFRYLENVLR